MRPSSEGDVVVTRSSPAPSGQGKRPAAPSNIAGRQEKRPRLDHTHAHQPGKENRRAASAVVKDEKAMMEDLMSGLDASMFDALESSPARSQQKPSQQRSPAKSQHRVKVEYEEPHALRTTPKPLQDRPSNNHRHAPTAAAGTSIHVKPKIPAFRPVKLEPKCDVKADASTGVIAPRAVKVEQSTPVPRVANVKTEPKTEEVSVAVHPVAPMLEEDDEFDFALDLGDLADLDDDLLLKPAIRSTVSPPRPDSHPVHG